MNFFKTLFAFLFYNILAYAGNINPDSANPIVLERTNESATSSYTFYMSLDSRLPASTGIIRITFPISTFSDPSKNPSLATQDVTPFTFIQTKFSQVTLTQNNVFYTTDGTLTANYLSATWNSVGRYLEIYQISDSINAGSLQISIKFIRNPDNSSQRVSGNFQIQTYIQSTLVDENLSFGKVTFSSAYVQSNQATISNDGSNLGGSITNYKYTFSTTVTLPANTWFRLRFPSAYTFGVTSCKLVEINASLTCQNNGDNVLILSAIGSDLPPDVYNLQIKNVINPTYTDFFVQFVLECLYPGTNIVLQLFFNPLSGIDIAAGQIVSPAISGSPLNMNLRIDYTITFTPTNTIPYPGKITIVFPQLSPSNSDPNIRKFVLDSTCRVISGLTPISGLESVTCVTGGSTMTITSFQDFYSQEIMVRIYATNPGRAALYTPFTISTYLYDINGYHMVDQNLQAGSVLISQVNSLKFVQIDFFTPITNGTFSQQIPLDFRLYPNQDKELPLSLSTTNAHEISIQIPLLWRNWGGSFDMIWQHGNNAGVTFGNDPAFQGTVPKYHLHIYQFKTPTSTLYLKYPLGYGLGQCDLPISIANVIMPPFGGKYLFRVHTFLSGVHYVNVPQEQDLYQMDIAIPPFPSATITTTGTESGDTENVVIASLKVGLNVPYEGAINFNMTTITIYTESSSKWDVKLGQNMGVATETINVPCSVYIAGDLSGFTNSNHPNARCFVFKGSELQNVILQVRGFSTAINGSQQIGIYIPNVRLCEDYQKGCYITVSSAYTSDLIDPYILNTIKVKVVSSINTASLITKAANTAYPAAPTYGTTVDDREICLFANWNLGSSFYSTPFTSGDSIVLIFPSYRFTYRKTAVLAATWNFGTASGQLIYVDYYINDQTYYIITLNANVPVGQNLLLTYIKNANDVLDFGPSGNLSPVNQGIIITGFFWQSGIKIKFIEWGRAGQYTDGGILHSGITILPNEAANTPNVPVRQIATDMEWESEVVYQMYFENCRIIPEGGLLKIQFPSPAVPFKSIKSTCLIKTGLTGISQLSLQSSIVCQLSVIGGINYLIASNFQKVAQETPIIVIFRATNPPIQASTWNPGLYHITSHDETVPHVLINFSHIDPPAPLVAGPNIFPTMAVWQSFFITDRLARQSDNGYFKMLVTSPFTFPMGSLVTIDFGGAIGQPFQLETIYDLEGWTMQGYIYCSINGDIAEYCEISGNTVYMKLPKSNSVDGVLANVQYEIIMGYKGNDDSSSTRDGFLIGKAGDYILSASIVGGGKTASTQKSFRNLAPSFLNFWIYSINKMNTDKTDIKCYGGGTQVCGLTVVVIEFSFLVDIPASIITNVSETQLVIEFSTQIDSVFTNGFAKDLGTGLPQRSNVPCEVMNILPLVGYDQITCRLYLGTKPNPTQIVISKFAQMSAALNYEIHIPDIFNPNAIKQLLQISLRAETTITNSASTCNFISYFINIKLILNSEKGVTTPIYENFSKLVNMTNTLLSYPFHNTPQDYVLSAACQPVFDQVLIDTPAKLSVCFKTSVHRLQPGDHMLFQFPNTWTMRRIDLCALDTDFSPTSNRCYSYNTNKQILIHVTLAVPPLTETKGTIFMNTPPYAAIIPETGTIFGYTYWRTRIVSRFTLPQFTQALTPLTILAANMLVKASTNVQGAKAEYTIKYDIIRDIPAGGCIQIIIPIEFKGLYLESICRNGILEGSNFDPYGYQFACKLVTTASNDYLLVQDFGPFKINYVDPTYGPQVRNGTTLYVNFRVTNPNIASPSTWGIKQWYRKESPLNLLVAVGTTPSPALIPAVAVLLWEKLLQTRQKLYTTEVGPLEFIIKTPFTIPAGSFVTVQMPASFIRQDDAQLFCYWDLTTYYNNKFPAHTCHITPTGLVTIEAPIQQYLDLVLLPLGSPIPASQYIMLAISSLDHYYGNNGIIMPPISQFYDFTITFGSTPGSIYVANRRIYLPHIDRFQIFEPSTIVNNPNEKTAFDIYMKLKVACNKLILYVPVLDQEGNDLFDEDLGTGKKNGDSINCQYGVYVAGVQTGMSCFIFFGDKATNTHARIIINGGVFNPSTIYQIVVDEVRNPNILTDDRHVYLILEGYVGTTLVTSEINYDFSFKYISTSNVLSLNPDPTLVPASSKYNVAVVMGGSGAGPIENNINYDFQWTQQVVKADAGNQYYDYFIVEFPSYGFNKQPYTVTCSIGTCRLFKGWNWAVWKYDANKAVGATVSMTLQGLENAKISSTTIHLLGYTIKNRVIVDKKYFLPLNQVTPISPSSGDFSVVAPDYPDTTKIPKSQYTKYLFTLKLPVTLESNKGIIDFIFPSSYVPSNYCSDTLSYPIYPSGDYISCVYTSTINAFTVSNYGDVSVSTTIQLEGWAQNPSSAATAPSFTVNIYQDSARIQKLMTFNAAGPDISNYESTVYAKHHSQYNQYIRTGTYGEFWFIVAPNTSLGESSYLILQFPNNDVSAQGKTQLNCGFVSSPTTQYEAATCIVFSSSPLQVYIYGPIEVTLAAATSIKVYVTLQNAPNQGLYFSGSGETLFRISNSVSPSSTTDVLFTIYPTANFPSLATLETTHENAASIIDIIVTVQTSVAVPIDGRLVVAFPLIADDGSTALFASSLGKSVSFGAPVDCSQKPLGTSTFGCVIETNFRKTMISLRLSSGLNSAISLLINDITLPSAGSQGNIPIEVYTVDSTGTILEAFVFEDILTPVTLSISPITNPLTVIGGTSYQFPSVNLGASTWSYSGINDRIVFKFPIGYDLSSATFFEGTTYASTEYIGIGNIMIVRLRDTLNSGVQTFQIDSVVNPATKYIIQPSYIYVSIVTQSLLSTQYRYAINAPQFTSAILTLPIHKSNTCPIVISIAFIPPSTLFGSNTVYVITFNGSSAVSASRQKMSLPCSTVEGDSLYCQLLPPGTYYNQVTANPIIMVSGIGDVAAASTKTITIYNIQEYIGKTTISVGLQAISTQSSNIKYSSTLSSLTLTTTALQSAITSTALSSFTTTQIRDYEPTVELQLTIDSSTIIGATVIFFYDVVPTQTLSLAVGTADIFDNGTSIGTCTIDSTTFFTSCVLTATPSTNLYLTLTNFPNPTVEVLSSTIVYQTIAYKTTKVAFQYNQYTLSATLPTQLSSPFNSPTSNQVTTNTIKLTFTPNSPVPALGEMQISLSLTLPGSITMVVTEIQSQYLGTAKYSLSGNLIIISGFTYMDITGAYEINFSFSDSTQIPSITGIKTVANNLPIEYENIIQTSSASASSPGLISVDQFQFISGTNVLLKFTTSTTLSPGSIIIIQFNAALVSFSANMDDYTLLSLNPTITTSSSSMTLKNFGTYTAGQITIRLVFQAASPTSIIQIQSIGPYYDIIDEMTASFSITSISNILISKNIQAFNCLNYNRQATIGGNNEIISFRFKLKTAMTGGTTDQLMITFPSDIDIASMYTNKIRVKCNIKVPFSQQKYRANKCHFQKLTLTYLVIQSYAFAINTVYDVSIIRLDISSSTRYYWSLPTTPKPYYFIFDRTSFKKVQDPSTPTIYTSDSIKMDIFANRATGISFTNQDGSLNMPTLMNIQFAASGATGYMDIEFPLQLDTGASQTNLFDLKLGSSNTNGISFPCFDKISSLGTSVKYRLFFGLPALMIPSRIRIIGAASSAVNINIQGLFNPQTVAKMTPIIIKSGSSTGGFGSYESIKYAVYTYSYSVTSATLPTPSFSPTTASTAVTATISSIALLSSPQVNTQSNLKFAFDSRQYLASMNEPNSNVDFMSKGIAFFTFTSTQSTPYTLIISNIKTPPIVGLWAYSSYIVSEIKNRKVRKVFTVAISQTLVIGGNFIINQVVSASSYRKAYVNSLYTFQYDLQEDQIVGNVIVVKFPTEYSIAAGLTCKLIFISNLLKVQNTCASSTVQNGYIITLAEPLFSGTSFKIQAYATNKNVFCTTGVFKIAFYKDATLAELQSQPTIPGVNIVDEFELVSKLWQPYSIVRTCQQDDTCPIRFSIQFTTALTKETDSIVIGSGTYIGTNKMINLQTPILELACWIGDYASYYCYQDTVAKTITIQTPVNTALAASTTYHVYITSWRDPRHQPGVTVAANLVRDFYLLPSYTQFVATPAIFKNVIINYFKSGASNAVTKDWQFVNKAFFRNNPSYFCSYSTTINQHSILKVRFSVPLTMTLTSALITEPNWSKFVIYLETANEVGQVLFPYTVDTRFVKDGQQIDCICNNCSTDTFLCYVQYGGIDVSAPAQITIQPQQTTPSFATTIAPDYIITFPKIKLPLAINYYVRIGMKALTFNSATKVVDQRLEALSEFVFYTNLDNVFTSSAIALGYPANHFVGEPLSVTWDYDINYVQRMNTRDRTIMTTSSPEMIIEHPINPSGSFKTSSPSGNVYIYPLVKWVEIELKVTFPVGPKSITTNLFKNMPYQITNGVDFFLYTYSDGEQRNVQLFDNIPYKNPHVLFFKKFDYVVRYISQPNTITPFNKIPLGGYISVYWGSLSAALDNDWVFQNNYCRVVSGLQDAQCIIQPVDLRIIIFDFSIQYDPVPDGVIKFYLKVSNSNNPGNRVDFSVTSFWDQTGFDNRSQIGGTASLRHMIDEDLHYSNFLVVFMDLLQLTLLERYQEDIPVCGGTRGPIVLKFQFRKDYVYPFDYIEVNFYQYILPQAANEDMVCYFADTTNAALVFVKTFRCDLLLNSVIQIYMPEETTIYASKAYLLVIDQKTTNAQGWGLQIQGPSMIRWTRISTSKEGQVDFYGEVAWIEANIPPCPFDPNNFRVYSFSHEYNTEPYANAIDAVNNQEKYYYTFINVTLATINNNIYTGLMSDNKRTRFVFEFVTHNGAFPVWDEDVTGHKYTTAQQASCGQLYNKPGVVLQPAGQSFLNCTIIPAAGQMPATPAYILLEGHSAIVGKDIFNLNLGHIKNPNLIADGTPFTQIGLKVFDNTKRYQAPGHMRIHVQQKQADGQFYSINEQWRYYLVPQFLDIVPPMTYSSTVWKVLYYYNAVNVVMRNVTTFINPLGQYLTRLRSAVVHQYSYPYQLVHWSYCKQHNYLDVYLCQNSIYCEIPHGYVACVFQPWSGWIVMSNNLNTYQTPQTDALLNVIRPNNQFGVKELEYTGNRKQPPFTYLYSNAKSLFRGWIYDSHRTVGKRIDEKISPSPQNCGVVMETTHHDNPQNRDVLYRIGLYISTLTREMQTIRLLAPNEFLNFQHCRLRRGVVLIDFTDISNDIQCTIIKQATNWQIEVTNFVYKEGQADGLIIIELLVTNPYDSGWTNHWICRTFTQQNPLMIHDYQTTGYGRTWVGKYIPYPNLFRVYRNTISFQNRRASINQYAELHMRIIPFNSHPQTDDIESTEIQVWMPLSNHFLNYSSQQHTFLIAYDIPNGGTNVCFVDHIYHTDIDGQYCTITSDRKVFVHTNKYQGLPSKCGLVSYTTVGAINGNNGVKMPPIAGDDEFQAFITSKDKDSNVKQEYSNLGASTEPATLTATAYPAGNSLTAITNVYQNLVESRYMFSFYSPRALPAGYDTSVGISDASLKNPISYIDFAFNTLDSLTYYATQGWNKNLILTTQKNPFSCKAFGGLIAKPGEKLICTILPSPMINFYYPVKVRITNYQAISVNTFIEIHFLNVPNPPYNPNSWYVNSGWVYIEAYQVKGDGTINYIIDQSQMKFGTVTLLTIWDTWTSNRVSVSPNQVGAYSEWTFSFDQLYDSKNAFMGCFSASVPQIKFMKDTIFQMKIPNLKFILVDDGKMQATLGGVSMKTWMYEDTNQIFFRVEQTMDCGYIDGFGNQVLNVFKITQLRNAAFKFPSPYSILIDTYYNLLVVRSYIFMPISNPESGSFVSTNMYLSKYYADERYVNYIYEFTPSYAVPAGSSIQFYLPTRSVLSFPQFGQSMPSELCIVSNTTALSQSVCSSTFSPTGFTVSVLSDIAEQTALQVKIIGTRNHPTYAQMTLSTDFGIKIFHPTSYEINSGYFPPITYLKQRDTSYIYFSLKGTSYFQNIIADYTFVLQSTTYLPLGGYISIVFPVNYLEKALTLTLPVPDSLTGSWTSNSLIFSGAWLPCVPLGAPTTCTYKITPKFAWPAKSSLTLIYYSFPNPMSTIKTSIFSAYSTYDSKQVDITDPSDISLYFAYIPQPDPMTVGFSFTPINEGTLASYSFDIKSGKPVAAGSYIQLTFDPAIYPSNLSTSSKTISCKICSDSTPHISDLTKCPYYTATCSSTGGVATIKVEEAVPANQTFNLVMNDIMNPTQGTTTIVGQISQGSTIESYNSQIGPVVTGATPDDLKMSKLSTSSTALGSKASYSICVSTSKTISATAAVNIYFPSQFPFKGTYPCSITTSHSNTELPYTKNADSPKCDIQNSQKRISITGQTAGKTSSNLANLCYQIDGVENPSLAGETDNFQIQIFDPETKKILFETSGLTSTTTSLSFARAGYQVIVSSIPDLPKGVTSNSINIELEIAVSYTITAIPYLKNFEFIPPIIVFDPTKGKVQTFKIKPLESAEVGSKQINWTKGEQETPNKFSEIPDTSFNFIASPFKNSLKAVLQTHVSRTALLATSLPIEIRLNQPASNVLTVNYYTKNHLQDSKLVFNPTSLVFEPGEISKSFKFTTKNGAVSGQIMFELDSVYSQIYIMPYSSLSFEILDADKASPKVINYYIESLDRTYLYLRISSDESVVIYAMMTLLGTQTPTVKELKDTTLRTKNKRITDVLEYYSNNSSYVAPVTRDYIYYDTYLLFDRLTEQTDYLLYFFAEDLSGNSSPVYNFTFSTLDKHNPVHFSLRVNQTIADSTIYSAFGLITSFSASRFSFISKPNKYSIPENLENEVQAIIDTVPMDYEFILLPNKTSNERRPIQTVSLLQDQFDLLQSILSTGFSYSVLDPTFNINKHAYEMYVIPQEFKYKPTLITVDEESASFLVSLKYKGFGYGIVQLASSPPPTSYQIRNGLNSSNYYLDSSLYAINEYIFSAYSAEDHQNITKTFKFSGLLDNSQYYAYFIGENSQLENPDLMTTNNIVSYKFTTKRESITIPDWFIGDMIGSKRIELTLIMTLIIFLLI